jgi:glutathione S-transferase
VITLHAVVGSHPCLTAEAALRLKGLEYERVDLVLGKHVTEMPEIYGEGAVTVPGAMIDGEPVHGSRAILARLDALVPEPELYPTEAVREAERWGDEVLQARGRRLLWGAAHFRPEHIATLAGGAPLDPAGTDYAIRMLRGIWKYVGVTCERVVEDLAALPGDVAHVRELTEAGVLGGATPNAADLQIAATLRLLLVIGDLRDVLAPVADYARSVFPDYPGEIPAGAFPAGWA